MKRKRAPLCRWGCGQVTKNISRICDSCWADRHRIFAERKARDAVRPRQLSAKQRASLEKATAARRAKLTQGLAATGLSGAEGG